MTRVGMIPKKAALLALAGVLVVSIILSGCSGGAPEISGLKHVSSFEGGHKYLAGKLGVLLLSGTYNEMGRQYGGLMKEEMHQYSAYIDKMLARPRRR